MQSNAEYILLSFNIFFPLYVSNTVDGQPKDAIFSCLYTCADSDWMSGLIPFLVR